MSLQYGFPNDYQPQFSGHETFPLRYGWLKKAFDQLSKASEEKELKKVFTDDSAIAHFGVGRNMVNAIKHWSIFTGILENNKEKNGLCLTDLAHTMFNENGLDPYMENPSTLWLIHWNLASNVKKTTWYYVFNCFNERTFYRDVLVNKLVQLSKELEWNRVTEATIKRDVDCFIRTYTPKDISRSILDDTLESPLTELGLIRQIGKKDGFRLVPGSKSSLGMGVFYYSVIDYWNKRHKNSSTISLETVSYSPGSPGRVFLLTEEEIADRILQLDDISDGKIRWSETAGLRQLVRTVDFNKIDPLEVIHFDYNKDSLGVSI